MGFFQSALDAALEVTVPLSFSRVGFSARERLLGWPALSSFSMAGKRVMVTGATSGLGFVTAVQLAKQQASVAIVARDEGRGQRAREAISQQAGGAEVSLYLADLSSLEATRGLARQVLEREKRLDVLIHNAGAMYQTREQSPEGHEKSFATMVLSPFALTNALVALLEKSAPSRVILVSSGGMYLTRLRLDDLEYTQSTYDGATAYARAKRAQVVLAEAWAHRLGPRGITVASMHPGWANTPGVETSLPRFHSLTKNWLRTAEQGADTVVWLACAPEAQVQPGGAFWLDRRAVSKHLGWWTHEKPNDREALWAALEQATR